MLDLRRHLAIPVILTVLTLATPAEAGVQEGGVRDRLDEALETAQQATDALKAEAQQAIVLGAALLYDNRHTVAGGVLGCAAGTAVGATSAAALAPVTGGATLAGAGYAALLGCGVGAVVGAQMGYPLDHVFEEE